MTVPFFSSMQLFWLFLIALGSFSSTSRLEEQELLNVRAKDSTLQKLAPGSLATSYRKWLNDQDSKDFDLAEELHDIMDNSSADEESAIGLFGENDSLLEQKELGTLKENDHFQVGHKLTSKDIASYRSFLLGEENSDFVDSSSSSDDIEEVAVGNPETDELSSAESSIPDALPMYDDLKGSEEDSSELQDSNYSEAKISDTLPLYDDVDPLLIKEKEAEEEDAWNLSYDLDDVSGDDYLFKDESDVSEAAHKDVKMTPKDNEDIDFMVDVLGSSRHDNSLDYDHLEEAVGYVDEYGEYDPENDDLPPVDEDRSERRKRRRRRRRRDHYREAHRERLFRKVVKDAVYAENQEHDSAVGAGDTAAAGNDKSGGGGTGGAGAKGEMEERKARQEREKAAEEAERAEREERAERSAIGERGERAERTERSERGMRGERGERGERAERGERSERNDRAERGDRSERAERGERGERAERGERGERSERTERTERGIRGERGYTQEGVERTDRTKRGERMLAAEKTENEARNKRAEDAAAAKPAGVSLMDESGVGHM